MDKSCPTCRPFGKPGWVPIVDYAPWLEQIMSMPFAVKQCPDCNGTGLTRIPPPPSATPDADRS